MYMYFTYIHTYIHKHTFLYTCVKTYVCICGFTVWKELEKENKEFFEAYTRKRAERATVMETRERLQNLLSNSIIKDAKE